MALSTAVLALPHETSGCFPDGAGGEICYASTGPGPMGPVAGILFLGGLALPALGLLVLGTIAERPSTRAAFLAGGISLLAVVSAIVAVVFLVGTL